MISVAERVPIINPAAMSLSKEENGQTFPRESLDWPPTLEWPAEWREKLNVRERAVCEQHRQGRSQTIDKKNVEGRKGTCRLHRPWTLPSGRCRRMAPPPLREGVAGASKMLNQRCSKEDQGENHKARLQLAIKEPSLRNTIYQGEAIRLMFALAHKTLDYPHLCSCFRSTQE